MRYLHRYFKLEMWSDSSQEEACSLGIYIHAYYCSHYSYFQKESKQIILKEEGENY